ncbi:MAG: phosphoribosylanthranilate isomerase [Thermodesulfobacteriota bacterium]|nr:phosphoribosylanthranilate isomerase [Thermodesulfobacteriota bacterium]
MTEIKICGMTNIGDATNAAECGADALGFIFYRKSPRYITPEVAREIIRNLSHSVCKVGVFVDHDVDKIKEIVEFCGLDLIQLHGSESPQYCRQFPKSKLIKAIAEKTPHLFEYSVSAILLDAYHPKLYGGTGEKSDWDLAVKIKENHTLILSGGLNPENIREALKNVSPDAVDINSGVELSPGRKDPEKVKKIIEIVKQTESMAKGTVFEKWSAVSSQN